MKSFRPGDLQFELASRFARVEMMKEGAVCVVMLDRLAGFTVSNLSTHAARRVRANERFVLPERETVRFELVQEAAGWADIRVGDNSQLLGMGLTDDRHMKHEGTFMYLDVHHYGNQRLGTEERVRRYVVNIETGWYYDAERKAEGKLQFPFNAPWKDWNDYYEHFTDRNKTDWLDFCRRLGDELRRRMEGEADLKEHVAKMSDGETGFICSPDQNALQQKSLVMVKKTGDGHRILGAARIVGNDVTVVCRYDDMGHLRWLIHRYVQTATEFDCEFNAAGELTRHMERKTDGRGPLAVSRWFQDRAQVPLNGRAEFLVEVEKIVRPLEDAWCTGRYKEVSTMHEKKALRDSPQEKSPLYMAGISYAQWDVTNAVRRTQGLAPLSSWEKKCLVRAENLEKYRKNFEQWRQKMTGVSQTTELDRKIDLERARLVCLKILIEGDYRLAKKGSNVHPERLEELLVTKLPDKVNTILKEEAEIRDVWGREYRYYSGERGPKLSRNRRPIIVSAGPDGVFDTEDDLSNDDIYVMLKRF